MSKNDGKRRAERGFDVKEAIELLQSTIKVLNNCLKDLNQLGVNYAVQAVEAEPRDPANPTKKVATRVNVFIHALNLPDFADGDNGKSTEETNEA